jgi:hypothetical protein
LFGQLWKIYSPRSAIIKKPYEIQRRTHISEGEKEMVDYFPLRPNGWKLPDPEPDEEQEGQQPNVVEAVYNYHEDGKSMTIAIKVSLQLPLPIRSRTSKRQLA